jgi:transcriptional regulator with AAA-type ATPase domain
VDIPVLANRFVARYCAANGLPLDAKVFSDEAVSRLISYHWPGQHPRAGEHGGARGAFSPGSRDPRWRHRVPARAHVGRPGLRRRLRLPTLRDAERTHIQRVLEAVSWNKKEAARVLEISRGTLYREILEYQARSGRAVVPRRHSGLIWLSSAMGAAAQFSLLNLLWGCADSAHCR